MRYWLDVAGPHAKAHAAKMVKIEIVRYGADQLLVDHAMRLSPAPGSIPRAAVARAVDRAKPEPARPEVWRGLGDRAVLVDPAEQLPDEVTVIRAAAGRITVTPPTVVMRDAVAPRPNRLLAKFH